MCGLSSIYSLQPAALEKDLLKVSPLKRKTVDKVGPRQNNNYLRFGARRPVVIFRAYRVYSQPVSFMSTSHEHVTVTDAHAVGRAARDRAVMRSTKKLSASLLGLLRRAPSLDELLPLRTSNVELWNGPPDTVDMGRDAARGMQRVPMHPRDSAPLPPRTFYSPMYVESPVTTVNVLGIHTTLRHAAKCSFLKGPNQDLPSQWTSPEQAWAPEQ